MKHAWALLSLVAAAAYADTYTLVLQPPNGYHVPRIIGASGSIDSAKGFTGFDYFEWFGITHLRYWFKPSFSPLNPTGGVQTVADQARASAMRSRWCSRATRVSSTMRWARSRSRA